MKVIIEKERSIDKGESEKENNTRFSSSPATRRGNITGKTDIKREYK